jgi:hypothetical protein
VVLVEQTLDKLFNNVCEIDNRDYYKVNLNNIPPFLLEFDQFVPIVNELYTTYNDEIITYSGSDAIITIADKDTDYKNFDDLFEKAYREKLEANTYNIFVSGGIDSTTLYNLLKSKDIAFKPYCIRYISHGIVFNDYEIKNVADDVNIIDFDIVDFFDSGKFLETAQKYHCITPQFLPLLKVFESIDGPILENSWPPDAPNIGNNIEHISIDWMPSRYLTYRYALDMRNDNSIFNFFRSHHFIDKIMAEKNSRQEYSKTMNNINLDQRYSIKAQLYKDVFNEVGAVTNKFTGFEALKVWYADKYIGNDPYLQVFDQHFREVLKQRNIEKFQDLKIICILKEK